ELTLLETDDEGTSGLWQLTPGTVTDTEVDESFLVLSGRGQVIFEDGSRILLEPGVTHRFSGGEKTTWTVEKTILKVYWIA
ncbi:MAG: cupin domain-containing protein, partial [Solirubrobacterales bacterium]|nr:cupin domain-containing protein [Solirubrobacterales bacterium]